uniref:Uncharacterized protein n=1 Tax=Siphoviridae sp. ctbrg2 TaxID=2823589 RepID=A0A8S5LG47_9CAUD|nr:MAG TPA: hypothetical protein [Siphoviridae sp. ctbrg2]
MFVRILFTHFKSILYHPLFKLSTNPLEIT